MKNIKKKTNKVEKTQYRQSKLNWLAAKQYFVIEVNSFQFVSSIDNFLDELFEWSFSEGLSSQLFLDDGCTA